MVNWFAWARGVLFGAVGWLIADLVAKMADIDLPILALGTLIFVLGSISIFLETIAQWLIKLYHKKKLKAYIGYILILALFGWIGWPRIQSISVQMKPKPPVISQQWMSEQETEQYIIDKLQKDGNREVFDRRVRYLLKWQTDEYILGQFRCAEDSVWRRLYRDDLITFPNLDQYDGSKRFSKYIGCEVQYSRESIYNLDWVKIYETSHIKPPNPDS